VSRISAGGTWCQATRADTPDAELTPSGGNGHGHRGVRPTRRDQNGSALESRWPGSRRRRWPWEPLGGAGPHGRRHPVEKLRQCGAWMHDGGRVGRRITVSQVGESYDLVREAAPPTAKAGRVDCPGIAWRRRLLDSAQRDLTEVEHSGVADGMCLAREARAVHMTFCRAPGIRGAWAVLHNASFRIHAGRAAD
jgi:hypothetical protein